MSRADDLRVPPIVVEREPVVVPDALRYRYYEPQFANRTFAELSAGDGTNGFGLGLSGRVGSTFSGGFYIGGSVTCYALESLTFYGDTDPPTALRNSGSLVHVGIEVGYDLGRSPFVLRFYGSPGYGSGDVPHGGGARGGFTAMAGLHGSYDLPRTPLFLSTEARATATGAEGQLFAGSIGFFGGLGVWLAQ